MLEISPRFLVYFLPRKRGLIRPLKSLDLSDVLKEPLNSVYRSESTRRNARVAQPSCGYLGDNLLTRTEISATPNSRMTQLARSTAVAQFYSHERWA